MGDAHACLGDLPRKELQRLAKAVGIKANGKSAEIVDNLAQLFASNPSAFDCEEGRCLLPASTCVAGPAAAAAATAAAASTPAVELPAEAEEEKAEAADAVAAAVREEQQLAGMAAVEEEGRAPAVAPTVPASPATGYAAATEQELQQPHVAGRLAPPGALAGATISNPLFDEQQPQMEQGAGGGTVAIPVLADTGAAVNHSLAIVPCQAALGGSWSPGAAGSPRDGGAAMRRAFERGRKSGLWQGAAEVKLQSLEGEWDQLSGQQSLGEHKPQSEQQQAQRGWKIPDLRDVRVKGDALKGAGFTTVGSPLKAGAAKRKAGVLSESNDAASTQNKVAKGGALAAASSRFSAARKPAQGGMGHMERAKAAEEAFKARRASALAKQQGQASRLKLR